MAASQTLIYAPGLSNPISDAVAQVNSMVVGVSPAVSQANFLVASGQAMAMAAHNSTSQQQHANIISLANVVQGTVRTARG